MVGWLFEKLTCLLAWKELQTRGVFFFPPLFRWENKVCRSPSTIVRFRGGPGPLISTLEKLLSFFGFLPGEERGKERESSKVTAFHFTSCLLDFVTWGGKKTGSPRRKRPKRSKRGGKFRQNLSYFKLFRIDVFTYLSIAVIKLTLRSILAIFSFEFRRH